MTRLMRFNISSSGATTTGRFVLHKLVQIGKIPVDAGMKRAVKRPGFKVSNQMMQHFDRRRGSRLTLKKTVLERRADRSSAVPYGGPESNIIDRLPV